MAPANIASISYFAPIAGFLLVFLVVYAIFNKTKILGDNKYVSLFVAFIVSTMFIALAGARQYIQIVTPWFAILVVSLAFLLAMIGFVGKPIEGMSKGIGRAFVIIMGIIFLISAFFVFSSTITPYLPGPNYGRGVEPTSRYFLDWLYSPSIMGAILLIIISAAVSWVLVKKDK